GEVEPEGAVGCLQHRERCRRDLGTDAVARHHGEADGGVGAVGRHGHQASPALNSLGAAVSLYQNETRRDLTGRGGLSRPPQCYAGASSTRSGAIGRARRRLPVIWNSALAMAGAPATTPISPMPVGAASLATTRVWISGRSLMRSTW